MTGYNEQLASRIRAICGERSIQEVGRLTGTHPETARRYIRGQTPPTAAFLASLSTTFGTSAEWLLSGNGPRTRRDAAQAGLHGATLRQLLVAVAERLEEVGARGANRAGPGRGDEPHGHGGDPGARWG
jgi:transcriptional regulator with XRE-family HTH domain